MNIFDRLNFVIENAEGSIITLVTTLIPWLTPMLPAWLTWHHLTSGLGIPAAVSAAMALAVEFLGLAAVSTAFQYMRHNQVNRAQKNRVSLRFPVGAYVFYIAIVVVINVILELPLSANGMIIVRVATFALLTLMSAPAFVIAVARDQQRKVAAEVAESHRKVTGDDRKVSGGETETYRKVSDWRNLPEEDRALVLGMATAQISAAYGVSERTALNWRKAAQDRERSNGKVKA